MLGPVTVTVVCDCMLITILSMTLKPQVISCAEATDALAIHAGDLKVENLLCLMCVFMKLKLF